MRTGYAWLVIDSTAALVEPAPLPRLHSDPIDVTDLPAGAIEGPAGVPTVRRGDRGSAAQ